MRYSNGNPAIKKYPVLRILCVNSQFILKLYNMVKVILTHEVKNVAEWKKGFDAGESLRAKAGVKTLGVYTSVQNPNHVTISTEFPSVEAVNGFMANPQLKADMEKAGVVGAPEVKILNKLH